MRVTGSYPRIDGAQYKGHMLKKGETLCVQKYVRTGPQELRRLKFGKLRLTGEWWWSMWSWGGFALGEQA